MHRRPNKLFHAECVQGHVQTEVGSVMFWRCFLYYELVPINEVNTKINQLIYFNIPDNEVLTFNEYRHNEHAVVTRTFREDNSDVHRTGRLGDSFYKHSDTTTSRLACRPISTCTT